MEPTRIEALLEARDHVHRLARRLLRDEHRAEDLAQQAAVAGLDASEVEAGGMRAYLAGAARHLASRERRSSARRAEREARAARPEGVPSSAQIVEREEWRRRVVDAVRRLGAREREVVLLRFFEGLPPRRIAKALDLPVETVKTRLKRGLARLRAELEAEHGARDLRAGLAGLSIPVVGLTTTLGPLSLLLMQVTKLQLTGIAALFIGLAWIGLREIDASRPAAIEPNGVALEGTERPKSASASESASSASQSERVAVVVPDERVEPEPGPVTIQAGIKVAGRVVDEAGQPVAGAVVRAFPSNTALGMPAWKVTCGARGEFELDGVLDRFYAYATADGFAPTRAVQGAVGVHERIEGLELRVAREASLEVSVVDDTGRPVEGVVVGARLGRLDSLDALTPLEDVFFVRPKELPAFAHPDESGVARFESRPLVSHRVEAHRSGVVLATGLGIPGEGCVELVTTSRDGVRGSVLDPRGQPVSGARVSLNSDRFLGSVRTDMRGNFVLAESDGGSWRTWLGVEAEGFAPHVREPLDWHRGDAPLVIRLETARSIAGILLHPDGRPAAGIRVAVEGDRYVKGDAQRSLHDPATVECIVLGLTGVETDERGRFRFEGLYDGEFELSVVVEEQQRVRRQVWQVRAGDERLELRLDPERDDGVSFEGTVRDALSGEPVESFVLTAMGMMDGLEGNAGSFNSQPVSFDDPEGRYRLGGFEPMDLGLVVRAPGYRDLGLGIEPRAAGLHIVDIELFPVRALEVRVVDEAREPIGNGMLRVADQEGNGIWVPLDAGGSVAAVRASAEGRAMLANLPATPISIDVYLHPGIPGPGPEDARRRFRFEVDLTEPIEGIHELVLRAQDDLDR